jgi:hypothetical protein
MGVETNKHSGNINVVYCEQLNNLCANQEIHHGTSCNLVDRYMIYDADYQLSHQTEKCNEFPNTLVCPY